MFDPQFEKGPSFDRARSQIATPFQYIDIALDVAASNQIFNVAGNFLYADAASTGFVTMELNNQHNDPSAPFKVAAGFGIEAIFKQLKLSWTAQAGKFIRLMYSTGDRIVPTNSTTISGGVNVILEGISYTNSYVGTGGLAANTPQTIFTPAQNVNGAVLVEAGYHTYAAATSFAAIVAKAGAAPVSITDGDVIGGVNVGTTLSAGWRLATPVKIPPGKGVYRISAIAESGAMAWALFHFL